MIIDHKPYDCGVFHMISSPIYFENPWLVGVVTGLIVIFAQSIWIATTEYRRWKVARADIPQRTMMYIKFMSHAVGRSLIIKDDMLVIGDQMGAALENFEDENKGFSDFISIFSKVIPSGWAVRMSRIADCISLASNYARRANAAWPTLDRGNVEGDPPTQTADLFVTDIGEIKGEHKTFTGVSDVEMHWKIFSQPPCLHKAFTFRL